MRVAKDRQLHKRRRRWRLAGCLLPLLVVAYGVWRLPGILDRGFRGGLPDIGVALLADPRKTDFLTETQYSGNPTPWTWTPLPPMLDEWNLRDGMDRTAHPSIAQRLWTWRLIRAARAHPPPGIAAPAELRTWDVRPVLDSIPACSRSRSDLDLEDWSPWGFWEHSEELIESVVTFCDCFGWLENGGDQGHLEISGHTLIVLNTPDNLTAIDTFLDHFQHPILITPDAMHVRREIGKRALPGGGASASAGAMLIIYDTTPLIEKLLRRADDADVTAEEVLLGIVDEILEEIDRYGWRDNGGDTSLLLTIEPLLLIETTPRNHEAIAEFLARRLAE